MTHAPMANYKNPRLTHYGSEETPFQSRQITYNAQLLSSREADKYIKIVKVESSN